MNKKTIWFLVLIFALTVIFIIWIYIIDSIENKRNSYTNLLVGYDYAIEKDYIDYQYKKYKWSNIEVDTIIDNFNIHFFVLKPLKIKLDFLCRERWDVCEDYLKRKLIIDQKELIKSGYAFTLRKNFRIEAVYESTSKTDYDYYDIKATQGIDFSKTVNPIKLYLHKLTPKKSEESDLPMLDKYELKGRFASDFIIDSLEIN